MTANDQDVSRWWILGGVIFFGLVLFILHRILVPFILGAAFTFIVGPYVDWLDRHISLHRVLIITLLYVLFFAPLAVLGYLLGPSLINELQSLLKQLPEIVTHVVRQMFGGEEIKIMGRTLSAHALATEVLARMGGMVGTPKGVINVFSKGIEVIVGLILSFVVLFYSLAAKSSFTEMLLHVAPKQEHPRILFFAERIGHILGRYLRGLVIIVAYAMFTTWIGMGVLFNLPFAIPLAVMTGLLELIPGIGPMTSWVLAILLAMVAGGFWTMIKVAAFYGLFRFSIDSVLGPIILGKMVTVSPILIIFSFLVGGTLFGVLGLLIAVPAAATIRLILESWDEAPKVPRRRRYEEDEPRRDSESAG